METPPFRSYEPLQDYYLRVARKYDGPNKVVLKTDLFNEAIGAPLQGGIIGNIEAKEAFGIELDPETYQSAYRAIGERAHQGDIRSLPYTANSIDTILDFSTLDHIPPVDLDRTLAGYHRVLNEKGIGVIIVWVSTLPSRSYNTPSPNELQYFFNKGDLDTLLRKHFHLIDEIKVYVGDHPSADWLHQFVIIK